MITFTWNSYRPEGRMQSLDCLTQNILRKKKDHLILCLFIQLYLAPRRLAFIWHTPAQRGAQRGSLSSSCGQKMTHCAAQAKERSKLPTESQGSPICNSGWSCGACQVFTLQQQLNRTPSRTSENSHVRTWVEDSGAKCLMTIGPDLEELFPPRNCLVKPLRRSPIALWQKKN